MDLTRPRRPDVDKREIAALVHSYVTHTGKLGSVRMSLAKFGKGLMVISEGSDGDSAAGPSVFLRPPTRCLPRPPSFMTKKSDKSRGICYRPISYVKRDSVHVYLDASSLDDKTQAVWTIQCILNLISFVVPLLASAGDGHKLSTANQKLVAEGLNAKIIVGGKKKASSVQNKLNDVCVLSCDS